jgi:hypothetical protein
VRFAQPFPFDEQYGLILDHLRLIGDDTAVSSGKDDGAMEIDNNEMGDEDEWEIEEAN